MSSRGHRPAAIAAALASLPFALPHVLEDFAAGTACGGLLAAEGCAVGLGAFLALQALGLALLAGRHPAGWALVIATGLVWLAGAAAEHGPAVAAGRFGRGPLSGLWLGGLVLAQGAAVVLAWRGWRAERRAGPR